MKPNCRLALIAFALAGGALLPQPALSGGIVLYEIATPDVGLASAGYAARAEDASTLFKNPAGMSRLHGSQLQTGAQFLYGSVEFSPDADTSLRLGRNDGGNAIGALPGMSFFYVHDLSEKWKLGLGSFSYFGLIEKYDDNWVGRYYVQESALLGVSLMPAVSFKANDWLSIGAGLNAMYGYLRDQVAINNLDPIGDGRMEVKDAVWGFGANAGILIEPRKGTRFGVTYLLRVNLDFADTPSFSNLGPGLRTVLADPRTIELGVQVPQAVMLGLYHELSARWAMMADAGWQDWSQFGEVDVGVESADSRTLTANLHYRDTWHGALGAQYTPTPEWAFSGGVAYDSSAVSDADRTVLLPVGSAWRFGLGAQWQANPKLNLGAAYEFLWSGDLPVDQGSDRSLRGRVSGSYDNTWFSFFTLNLSYKF